MPCVCVTKWVRANLTAVRMPVICALASETAISLAQTSTRH